MLQSKREQFRVELRKSNLERLFLSSRKIIQTTQMVTSEDDFFNQLIAITYKSPDYLEVLKQCEDYYNKAKFTSIVLKYFEEFIQQFKFNEEQLEILIHLFLHFQQDDTQVVAIMHKYNTLYQLYQRLEVDTLQGRVQQLVIFLFGELVQYSKMYRFAIKNLNVVNATLKLFDLIGVSNLEQNFYECFNFLVWSLISPEIKGMETVLDFIYPTLLEMSVAFTNFNSQFLLSIVFRSASEIGNCRQTLLQFNKLDEILSQISSSQQQIILDYLDFVNALLMEQSSLSPQIMNIIYQLAINGQYDSRIRALYMIDEMISNNNKLSIDIKELLKSLQNSYNIEVITAFFTLFMTMINKKLINMNDDLLLENIMFSIKQSVQSQNVWLFISYIYDNQECKNRLNELGFQEQLEKLILQNNDRTVQQIMINLSVVNI